jgi:FkbM family methyltransferase
MVDTFFFGVTNGTFVELGGFNGVWMSNTKMLEDAFGWRGVLIEANPEQYKFLKVNRPRAVVVNAPVGNFTRVRLVGSGGSVSVKKGGTSGALALPLDTILKGVGVRRIDFLSLDVEGYELHILRTLSIPVSVLMVESDKVDQAELHALLAARGMRRVTSTVPKWRRAANDYYVAADFKPSASPPECAPVAPPPLRSSKGHKKKNKRDLGTDSVGTGCVKFVRTSPEEAEGAAEGDKSHPRLSLHPNCIRDNSDVVRSRSVRN